MAVKLGTAAVTMYLGDQSVTGYLGSQIVTATVPGAPIGLEWEAGAGDLNWGTPIDNGGSAITEYKVYADGVDVTDSYDTTEFSITPLASGEYEVSAVNEVGEGPKAGPVTVTL